MLNSSVTGQRQQNIRKNIETRAAIIDHVRLFFKELGYLEVDTPLLLQETAPEAHIDSPVSGDRFLQSSPELCMKRLLAFGFDKIFQISKCFRKNERGSRHFPEFTMLEWYRAGADYMELMIETESLIKNAAKSVTSGNVINYCGSSVKIDETWERLTVKDAFERYGSIDMKAALAESRFDEIMGIEIEPQLGHHTPVFLFDYPIEKASLAKKKEADQQLAERFELYIAGVELCNCFSELTNPEEQRIRFAQELKIKAVKGDNTMKMPEMFLNDLTQMPDAAGNALGIDRLVMILCGAESIDDIAAFTPEEA